jgi:addiction module HigA family antidote
MKHPPHPGELIRTEILEPRGLTVSKAAKILKVSQTELSDLLQGKVDLWIRLANRIEKVFGIDAHLLLQMQSAYDLAQEADLVNRLLSFSTVDLERDRRMLAQIWEDERVHQNEQQAATPTIPLLVPRPGETLNTVQGYRFRETAKDLADIPTTLRELAKESRKRRSVVAAAKRDAFERVTPMPPTEYHDKLIDQIVAEIENISACYWRIDACRRALPADQRAFAGEQLATIFAGLANNRKVKMDQLSSLGKGNKKTPVLGLGQLKAVISSWRTAPVLSSSTIDLERDRRMLAQIWEDERVHKLVTGEPELPIAAHYRWLLAEGEKLADEADDREDLRLAEKSRAEVRAGVPTISVKEMKRRLKTRRKAINRTERSK